MPKISVLVPIFNVEKYLEECLDSIVNQTLKDIEIICINDGSTDSSLKIIKKYAKKDPRIVIIDKKNSGYGDSMNKGLKKATGEYIGIVESDDWIELTAFKELYDLARKHDAEVVKSNFYNYFTDPKKASLTGTVTHLIHPHDVGKSVNPEDSRHIFYQRPAIWSGLYSRTFLEQNSIQFLPSPGASYQDTGFNFKVWSVATRAAFTDKAYLHYRQDNEASSVNSPGKVFCVADEFKEIEKFLKTHDRFDLYGDIMRVAKWGAYAWNIDRLTADLAEDFIRLASDEYKKDQELGIFNFEHCDTNQVRAITEIINHPELSIQRKHASENAKVSVVMAAYNSDKYIRQSLDSVVNQSLKDIEIIIVDDGSTDNTPDIIEEYFSKDVRVKVINKHNGGQSTARNLGIEHAHAEYITFPDSDDYYNPDSLLNLYNAANKHNVDMSIGSINMVYEDNIFNAMQRNQDKQYYLVKFREYQKLSDTILKKTDVSPCNKMFKRAIIKDYHIRFPEGLKYEDAYFFHAYTWCSQSAYFIDPNTYVYNYVRRANSTMTLTHEKAEYSYDHTEIAEKLFAFLKAHGLFDQHKNYFVDFFKDYLNLTINHSTREHHEYTYNRARDFVEQNKDYLSKVDENVYKKLLDITKIPWQQDEALVDGAQERKQPSLIDILHNKASITIKKPLKVAMRHASHAYRKSQRTIKDIQSISHQLSQITNQNTKIERDLRELKSQVEKMSKK